MVHSPWLRPRPTQANYLLLRALARQIEQAIDIHLRPRRPSKSSTSAAVPSPARRCSTGWRGSTSVWTWCPGPKSTSSAALMRCPSTTDPSTRCCAARCSSTSNVRSRSWPRSIVFCALMVSRSSQRTALCTARPTVVRTTSGAGRSAVSTSSSDKRRTGGRSTSLPTGRPRARGRPRRRPTPPCCRTAVRDAQRDRVAPGRPCEPALPGPHPPDCPATTSSSHVGGSSAGGRRDGEVTERGAVAIEAAVPRERFEGARTGPLPEPGA